MAWVVCGGPAGLPPHRHRAAPRCCLEVRLTPALAKKENKERSARFMELLDSGNVQDAARMLQKANSSGVDDQRLHRDVVNVLHCNNPHREAEDTFSAVADSIEKESAQIMIHWYFTKGNLGPLQALVKSLLAQGQVPDPWAANMYLDLFARNNPTKAVEEEFRMLREHGLVPDIVTFTTLMNQYLLNKQYGLVAETMHIVHTRKLEPTEYTYSVYVRSLCEIYDWRGIRKTLKEMVGRNLTPSVYLWSVIMKAQRAKGLHKDVVKLVRKMRGLGVEPSDHCVTLLMASLGKLQNSEQIWEFYNSFPSESMSYISYAATIAALVQCQDYAGAIKLFQSMESYNWDFDNNMAFNYAIQAYTGLGDIEAAETVLECMRKNEHIAPCTTTYATLIRAHAKAGSLRRVNDLVEEMKIEKLKPTVYTFDALIFALGKVSVGAAEATFNEMERSGIEPTVFSYNQMMNVYKTHEMIDRLEKTWEQMIVRDRLKPDNYGINILLSAYVKVGNLRSAEKAFSYFRQYKLQPDVVALNCMLHGYVKDNNVDKLLQYLHTMRASKLRFDSVTYKTIVTFLVGRGLFDDARYYKKEAQRRGVKIRIKVPGNTNLSAETNKKRSEGSP
uniref:Pentacotripeptide-repeat region of PRORP domain-containing protein n=1 Tax=Rhodosorus marinus TaxID=101924 RepID=A0A7S3ABQ4_9RHOD|mmetsp:Transcript_9467/g.40946  ORF Transcript_9467/g.40946 Transcript_9467/m.40946 type:complete len:616 (+) Transcript_9467:3-1850(+)